MEFLKIVLLCIFAAVGYGVVHDQFTARVCVEYFTIGHPPVFNTNSPTLLGLGWGVIATWWVGLFLGVPLAMAARIGDRPKLSAAQLVRPVLGLLGVMAGVALVCGMVGWGLAAKQRIVLPDYVFAAIPREHHVGFIADWFTHMGSYAAGLLGGVVVIVRNWLKRGRMVVAGFSPAVEPGVSPGG